MSARCLVTALFTEGVCGLWDHVAGVKGANDGNEQSEDNDLHIDRFFNEIL